VAHNYEQVREHYERAVAGHVYIRETIDTALERLAAAVQRLETRPRILELGSHAGFLSEQLLERIPSAQLVVWEPDTELLEMSRRRLRRSDVEYHQGRLADSSGSVDIVLSVARHHHLPHDYLDALSQRMNPGGVYVLADELCPEYCTGRHLARIEQAEVVHVAGGYVLTKRAEVTAYRERGEVPPEAREMEVLRKRALWRWYRFVVDQAVERGYFDIAVGELQSTHDDLITGSDAEHKFSPAIVERQLTLAGFEVSRHLVGDPPAPELQSMFVFECVRPPAPDG
jgi:SAM-dependent methyltransferase